MHAYQVHLLIQRGDGSAGLQPATTRAHSLHHELCMGESGVGSPVPLMQPSTLPIYIRCWIHAAIHPAYLHDNLSMHALLARLVATPCLLPTCPRMHIHTQRHGAMKSMRQMLREYC